MSVRVVTWNLNSINARLPIVEEWFRTHKPEVACLQEIKCVTEKFPTALFEEMGYQCAVFGQKSYNGVALVSLYGLSDIKTYTFAGQGDEQARYVEALVETPKPFRVGGLYQPNGNPVGTEKYHYKLEWLKGFTSHAKALLTLEEATILCGDYNIIPQAIDCYKESVWLGDALYQPEVRKAFQAIKNLGYYDAYELYPDLETRYTYWDYQAGAWNKNEGIRIDHHLLSPKACDRLIGLKIHKNVREPSHAEAKPSDHVPVEITLSS